MPKMDFLGLTGKAAFKKRAHRPWNSKLIDESDTQDDNLYDTNLDSPASQPDIREQTHQHSVAVKSDFHMHLNQLYENNLTIGGFFRLPALAREKESQSQESVIALQQMEAELKALQEQNAALTVEKQQLAVEIAGLQKQFTLIHSERNALEADYQTALHYLQEEKNEVAQLQNQLLLETQTLEVETAKRIQAERNESLLNETLANFESERILLEKNKKAIEIEAKALTEKRVKMDAINENEQKLRKLYEERMKELHENIFELERKLSTESDHKQSLEHKIAQFFETMRKVENEKKEIENHSFILEQTIKMQENQILDLEARLQDEIKVRRAYEGAFSNALSKN